MATRNNFGPRPAAANPDRNLAKIDHIVVLMLENRSFDHYLGYLSLPESMGGRGRTDIDGLRPDLPPNLLDDGSEVRFAHLDDQGPDALPNTAFPLDPAHSHSATKAQIEGNMGRFAAEFAASFPDHPAGLVMGYYDQRELPVYDYLAETFCVCDRWFSSHRGATWVNRVFATAGDGFGDKENDLPYDVPTVFRTLDTANVSWSCFTHDFGTLRLLDSRYRFAGAPRFQRIGRFFELAARGELPSVSWIDPNFNDYAGSLSEMEDFLEGSADETYPYFPFDASDDHPPNDVRNAQQLVLELYSALAASPNWERTLFVITYDEHGGFYDHVTPELTGEAEPHDQFGVRVPALVVSPWVPRRSVGKVRFDHTSIVKTILQRFCAEDGRVAPFTPRVDAANHLGVLLTEPAPREDTGCLVDIGIRRAVLRDHLAGALEATRLRLAAHKARVGPTDLQRDLADARQQLAREGHDPLADRVPRRRGPLAGQRRR